MSAAKFSAGQRYKIIAFSEKLDPSFRKKLLTMGLCPNETVTIERVAPLGDPVELCVDNAYFLSLRKQELNLLTLEACA